jgi:hypothetical protein
MTIVDGSGLASCGSVHFLSRLSSLEVGTEVAETLDAVPG